MRWLLHLGSGSFSTSSKTSTPPASRDRASGSLIERPPQHVPLRLAPCASARCACGPMTAPRSAVCATKRAATASPATAERLYAPGSVCSHGRHLPALSRTGPRSSHACPTVSARPTLSAHVPLAPRKPRETRPASGASSSSALSVRASLQIDRPGRPRRRRLESRTWPA